MLVQQLDVNGLQRLEVIVTIFVQRRFFPGYKVVVQGYGYGIKTQDLQLDSQSPGALLSGLRWRQSFCCGAPRQPE